MFPHAGSLYPGSHSYHSSEGHCILLSLSSPSLYIPTFFPNQLCDCRTWYRWQREFRSPCPSPAAQVTPEGSFLVPCPTQFLHQHLMSLETKLWIFSYWGHTLLLTFLRVLRSLPPLPLWGPLQVLINFVQASEQATPPRERLPRKRHTTFCRQVTSVHGSKHSTVTYLWKIL